PGGSSLSSLLAQHRGARNHLALPRLTVELILAWADAHHARTGSWPRETSGPVVGAPGEMWSGVDIALEKGLRGLAGSSSLPRLLADHRGVRNQAAPPRLTIEQILAWADAHHARTGRWPNAKSGPIPEAREETWMRVATALREGLRGLPGDSSLAKVLADHRGVRNRADLPAFTVGQIRAWARAHYRRTGRWPTPKAGSILEAPGETWAAVAM